MNQAERNQHEHAIHDPWLERVNSTKTCSLCRELLPLEAFPPSTKNVGIHGLGRGSRCRSCDAARKRAARATKTQQPQG